MMNAFGPFGKNTEYNRKTDERKREKILLPTERTANENAADVRCSPKVRIIGFTPVQV